MDSVGTPLFYLKIQLPDSEYSYSVLETEVSFSNSLSNEEKLAL